MTRHLLRASEPSRAAGLQAVDGHADALFFSGARPHDERASVGQAVLAHLEPSARCGPGRQLLRLLDQAQIADRERPVGASSQPSTRMMVATPIAPTTRMLLTGVNNRRG